jgi:HAD superfamily hydrolase (TIGR01509 family)
MKAIIIGVGNTIIKSNNAWEYLTKKLNITEKQLLEFRDKYVSLAQRGKYSKNQLIRLFAKEFHKSSKEIIKAFSNGKSKLAVNKCFISFLSKLKNKGHKVALITNTTAYFSSFWAEKELYSKFPSVLSFKVKAKMPDIKMYKAALKKLKAKGKYCIYVDSKEERLSPAKKLGMETLLFINNKQLIKELKKRLR